MVKTLDVTHSSDCSSQVKVFGNPDLWQLLCKASNKAEGWMKSTKVLVIPNYGCVLQITTQQGDSVSEALAVLPGVSLVDGELVTL